MHTRTVDAPPAAPVLDDLRQSLPSMMVGEAPEVQRTHEWPGAVFIILSYVTSVALGGSAVGSAGWAAWTGNAGLAGWALLAGAGSVLQWRLAKAVEKSSRWGWYGAIAELGAAAATKVWAAFATGDVVGPAIGLVIDALWIGYFWERRGQFEVDDL
jgi:hypothetical protein